ncbi:MAG: MoaD/ThiS family protein [Candidatus Bathyarchaeia archaeon]
MVRVTVRFYASLRDDVGVGEVVVRLNDSSFSSLINGLRMLLGVKAGRIFSEDGSLRNGLMVSVNNAIIHLSNVQEFKLCEDDVVDFMPTPSGG